MKPYKGDSSAFKKGDIWLATKNGKFVGGLAIDTVKGKSIFATNPLSVLKFEFWRRSDGSWRSAAGWILSYRTEGLKVRSLSFPIHKHRDKFRVGCQEITTTDALKIFKWLGDQLGYDVED